MLALCLTTAAGLDVYKRQGQEGRLAVADPLNVDMLGDVEQLPVLLPLLLA